MAGSVAGQYDDTTKAAACLLHLDQLIARTFPARPTACGREAGGLRVSAVLRQLRSPLHLYHSTRRNLGFPAVPGVQAGPAASIVSAFVVRRQLFSVVCPRPPGSGDRRRVVAQQMDRYQRLGLDPTIITALTDRHLVIM